MNLSDPTLPIPSMEALRNLFGIAKQMATPPDPYQEAGRMVQQARQGDYLGALETGIGAMPNTGAIKAYHGSPHSFDRFDLSKVGTGEGAQAYGHGLYFADNEAVARAYRDKLAQSRNFAPGDLDLDMLASFSKGEAPEVRRQIEDLIDGRGYWDDFVATINNIGSDRLKKAIEKNSPGALNKGHMYEVRINAEPEHFLDWDKPFSQQSEHIQKALRSMPFQEHRFQKDMLGREQMGKDFAPDSDLFLGSYVQSGIPGIKYLDQGSRGAGEGSRNYVVFDDKLIDIMRKYGFVPFGAGVGMGYGAQDNQK